MTDSQQDVPSNDEIVATIALPHGVEAARVAREFVANNSDHLRPDLIEDAQLLVSEIVSNAVRHGQPEVTLLVRVEPPSIGVTVTDTGEGIPALPEEQPGPTQPSGRGLLIVDALASAWGVSPNQPPPGKAVWFEINASETGL